MVAARGLSTRAGIQSACAQSGVSSSKGANATVVEGIGEGLAIERRERTEKFIRNQTDAAARAGHAQQGWSPPARQVAG